MDLGLRDWLESIAGIKRKFVEELHPVLEEQHVADVDDLREFSQLPSFALCIRQELTRKRI